MLKRYENCICNVDEALLKNDEYTFSVLSRILAGVCSLTLTDGKRLIICYSEAPYPVWVWLPDNASEHELDRAYELIKESFGFNSRYRFNCKYRAAEHFINRAKSEGYALKVLTNMLAYSCPKPILPKRSIDGSMRIITASDVDRVAKYIEDFHTEVNSDIADTSSYLKKAKDYAEKQNMYFWIDESGEIVALCGCRISNAKGALGPVYTLPDRRRRGYAERLVYEVAQIMIKQGFAPCLYTDADYIASNSCYMGVGFKPKGCLCTIG